jgi:hypothetical protein
MYRITCNCRELSDKLTLHWRLLKEVGEVEMVLRVKGTSWAGLGWRPLDLTSECKKFPVLADDTPADAAAEPVVAAPQGRALDLDAAAAAEPEPPAAAAEPEPESEPNPEPTNQAALESAVESEGVGQQLPRNTR